MPMTKEQTLRYNELKKILEVKEPLLKEFQSCCQDAKSLSAKFKSICLIGVTGHGKSSTANSLSGEEEFFDTSPETGS